MRGEARKRRLTLTDEGAQIQPTVRFADKFENEDSIDSELRERMDHNIKYNDDTIFDNISIFKDRFESTNEPEE